MMKKWFTAIALILLLTLSACGGSSSSEPAVEIPDSELIELTLSELSAFDGRNGSNAYIAVDGFIYDVTGSPRWPNGRHNGYQAGQDLTQFIDQVSPHGRGVLSRMPRIGRLIEE